MKRNLKAIVFDVDGTLLDTREFIASAFEHSLAAHGVKVPERTEVMKVIAGTTLPYAYGTFAPNGDYQALVDTHREYHHRSFHLVSAYTGLIEVLAELRAHGLLLGICSSRANIRTHLEQFDALRFFDASIDANEVANHKPHPEGLFKVLELLNVKPDEAVMIGDTKVDIETGKAAGVELTIGLTHGFSNREALEQAGADYVVDSLKEILPLLV